MIDIALIAKQLPFCLKETNFGSFGQLYRGKVRDNYIQGKRRILVATDRLSAFDRHICNIPFKGQVLNLMAQFWFERTKNIIANHAIEFPDPNVMVAKQVKPLPVEMVVRGYLTGVTTTSAWYHYERGARDFCGNKLPDGMKKNQKFSSPIITPSTKAEKGQHDESISPDEIIKRRFLTATQWDLIKEASLKLYNRGREICAKQGIILVDTKYEFGIADEGEIMLIDEIHTPDSSRFWFENSYQELFKKGLEQKKIDKEYVREWLASQNFRGEGVVPSIPDEVRIETARRYIEAFELITGREFLAMIGDPLPRIVQALNLYQIS